jgi:hypothetical protein
MLDWIIEWTVYGGGGALLGCLLALFITSRTFYFSRLFETWRFIAGSTLIGFLAGALGGEPGINWIGQKLRQASERDH